MIKMTLSKFYKQYDDLMIFWNKNIPQFIHNIKYENLISDLKMKLKIYLIFVI